MTIIRPVKKKLLRRVGREVSACRKKKTHRPTTAVFIRHVETGLWLIVYGKESNPDDKTNPGIVKGGIDRREHVLKAGLREIFEEAKIPKSAITFKKYCGSYVVPSLKLKSGFAKKRYFIFYAEYSGPLDLEVNKEELSGYAWVSTGDFESALAVLKETRPIKYKVHARSFQALVKTL